MESFLLITFRVQGMSLPQVNWLASVSVFLGRWESTSRGLDWRSTGSLVMVMMNPRVWTLYEFSCSCKRYREYVPRLGA